MCTKGLARPILQFIFLEAGFRSRPVLGRLRLLVKENIIFEFLKTDYNLSNISLTWAGIHRHIPSVGVESVLVFIDIMHL